MNALRLVLILTLGTITAANKALAESVLIPVPGRYSHVYDPLRAMLYITNDDGQVERYDVNAQVLLPPWNVGATLRGLDLAPDGLYIYVCDRTPILGFGVIHKVNLENGSVTDLFYELDSSEGGNWDIGIGSGGKALFSGTVLGSGARVPFREVNLITDEITIREDTPGAAGFGSEVVRTHINRSADGTTMFMTEADASKGPIFAYDAVSDTFSVSAEVGGFLSGSVSAVSRDGLLIAFDHPPVELISAAFAPITAFADINGGVIFDPNFDILYGVDSSNDELVVINSITFAELDRLPIGENVSNSMAQDDGEMSISSDSRWVFLSTNQGIRMISIPFGNCTADITGDGVVGAADLAALLGCWGACPCTTGDCLADFNSDNVVGPADLALLLGSWAPCPVP